MYPNQKSESSVPPSDTAALVTDLNPWEDTKRPPTSIGLPPIQEFEPLSVDSLAETHKDLEDHQKMVLEDQQAVKGDQEQLLQLVQCSAESVVKTSDSTANQLSQLVAFVKELNQAMDTMVTIPITSSIALGSIVWHLGFIIQEHNIQTGPVCTFSMYCLITPPLKYLLLTLQWHEHLKIIPKILPLPQELSQFCKLIRSLHSQLTKEELATAPGLFMDFEMEWYLLDVTIQDPLTLPLSLTHTPSNTDSLEVEVTLTVKPTGLPVLDPETVHEAPNTMNNRPLTKGKLKCHHIVIHKSQGCAKGSNDIYNSQETTQGPYSKRFNINNPQSHYLQYHTGDHGWFANNIAASSLTLIHAQIINIKFCFNQGNTTLEPPMTPNNDEADTNE
ncbi:hypothetical protein BS47DRAFT_1364781 [Hydnum rufescens UP504]|uniref:Uncharacterized protein n=1 Tax=Hydnum rufescens UP504 TaxID=1448309 RepID=A0A9P6AQZ7_9AGAM|nr:hypothetical protein BS47DRAFT_1364781 [Hydnum rufescens UP504]